MQFTKLRLSGFKSFVDPTELAIEPGLTGVVGPNGCGKSNLVEGLRWVMGETSAKKMRGGGMDDVIFGGTADRPSRNIAEVMLFLDNSDRGAPASFNDSEELEISRRIEREQGSQYRINGKDVRARDVQLLFADLATGARSAALVSQGRVGALINAKPADRRILLEEAAGISGLHSRRHEAELRLRAAEANLERLEDVLAALDAQLKGLKKQARQASRYRNIGDHIRKAEATLLHLKWVETGTQRETAQANLDRIRAEIAQLTQKAAHETNEQAQAAEKLPALREAEARVAAELHRLTVARDALDAEEERLRVAKDEAATRLAQTRQDIDREQSLAADAQAAIDRLNAERQTIAESQSSHDAAVAEAEGDVGEAETEVDRLETGLSEITEAVVAEDARREALVRRIRELEERMNRLRARAEDVLRERAELAEKAALNGVLERAETAVAAASAAVETRRNEAEQAEQARSAADRETAAAREQEREAGQRLAALKAEERTLANLLAEGQSEMWPPLLDSVRVASGYEAALGAALGDDLIGALDPAAPAHWRALAPFVSAPPLPFGVAALADYVEGPAVMARRLGQIGVVADRTQGERLAGQLRPGQRLVSQDGDLWRWDGYTVSAGAGTAAGTRLAQRNRLSEVRDELVAANAAAEDLRMLRQRLDGAAEEAANTERRARAALQAAYGDLSAARESLSKLERDNAETAQRIAALDEASAGLENDLAEAEADLGAAREASSPAIDLDGKRAEQTAMRESLTGARGRLIERRSRHDRLLREAEAREERLQQIGADLESWLSRQRNAQAQHDALTERLQATEAEIARLTDAPVEIAEKRNALAGDIEGAEARRREAADILAEAESALAEIAKRLRAAEGALADAREERARAEGVVAQIDQTRQTLTERAEERLQTTPENVLAAADVDPEKGLPEVDAVEARLERLIRERDNMGPVNLRAEQEAAELQEQIDGLEKERNDLIEAIARLRQAINELNREGRERLLTSFREVNSHFEELFTRLFGGGRAYLKLIESDDPLEAGLEIFASPPGKKLQVLSLLSGGEQALTALALLFSVFLTNPAPICVLDEVDAPLDDANVDRFCTLLSSIAAASDTRFMVVTHHRMTMARMDRLYGVTMPEQGVSQLVSVDLQTAEELRDSA